MKLSDKKILVTGGAGFLGSHLVDALINDGCRVRVLDNVVNGKIDNLNQHRTNNRFEMVVGDVTKSTDVGKAMQGIDIVFHLACLGVRHSINHPFENHKVNAEGSLVVLEEARNAKIKKFIYLSSSEVYGTAKYVPMPEDHPTYPCTIYGASKLAGEAYTRAYHLTHGFNTVILRSFNMYGPRSHYEGNAGEMIPRSIVRALNGEPIIIFGDGTQTRDFTYVEDIANALVMAARCDEIIGKTLNAGSGFEISMNEIAQQIVDICGSSSKIEHQFSRPGDVLRLYSDSTLFRKITGWAPKVGFKEGISRTAKYLISKSVKKRIVAERNWE